MEALAKLWRERHVDWSPILDVIHSETGKATVESMNGLLAMVGCGTPASLLASYWGWMLCVGRDCRNRRLG